MKAFKNKLKKTNKFIFATYIIVLVAYLVSLAIFTKSILALSGIETFIRTGVIAALYLLWIFYAISGLVLMFQKKNLKYFIFTIILALLVPVFIIGSNYINRTYNTIAGMSNEEITYTSNLVSMNTTEIDSKSRLGMINDTEDLEGNILAKKLIKKENISNEIIEYDDYFVMLNDLYKGEIDGIFVSGNYVVTFANEEAYETIKDDTKVIYSYSEKMKNQDIQYASNKSLKEPISILLIGVDSTGESMNANQSFNGDTLMLITFNPQTLNATMFSIPRDTYVPIACRKGAKAKINSSAAYGTKCVIDTVEDLTSINIDYYVKINFKGTVDLVEALGGIDVNVPIAFCEQNSNREFGNKTICLKAGEQHVNGEQALAFARHRKSYAQADIIRIQNQQQIVESVAQKAKTLKSFDDFEKVLKAIEKNIDTNMSTKTILSFYNVGKDILLKSLKKEDSFISIQKSYLEYYSMNIPGYAAIGYYQDSLNEIVNNMKVNLGLEKPTPIKTFSYKYDENYEIRPMGKGKTGKQGSSIEDTNKNNNSNSTKVETLPSFRGESQAEIIAWCKSKNISVDFQQVNSTSSMFETNKPTGYVLGQSINVGTPLKDISYIIAYVNYNPKQENNNNEQNNNEEQNNNNPVDPPVDDNNDPQE